MVDKPSRADNGPGRGAVDGGGNVAILGRDVGYFTSNTRCHDMLTVGVIGGGPAGAVCAWHLARAGVRTLLYERRPDNEKPCGGGLTGRAFAALPELETLDIPWREIREWRMVGANDRAADLQLERPLRIVARHDLDGALRREAVKAGAALVPEPVRELSRRTGGGWQINDHAVDIAVGAGGMRDPLARHLGIGLKPSQIAVTVGRIVPGAFPDRLVTRFHPEYEGYMWWFPRRSGASLGIEMRADRFDRATALRLLNEFRARHLPEIAADAGTPYGWTAPSVLDWPAAVARVAGPDWLLCGDAAGLCDATTGEGIPYALASGRLAAAAIVAGDLPRYVTGLAVEVLPELAKAARLQRKFYRPRYLAAALWVMGRSARCREIAEEMTHGTQSYVTLRARVTRALPRMMWESLRPR